MKSRTFEWLFKCSFKLTAHEKAAEHMEQWYFLRPLWLAKCCVNCSWGHGANKTVILDSQNVYEWNSNVKTEYKNKKSHLATARKTFHTDFALIWLLARMQTHVQTQAFLNRESFAAIVACECFARSMLACDVVFQTTALKVSKINLNF